MPLTGYEAATGTYDEMFTAGMRARPGLGRLVDYLKNEDLTELRHDAELAIRTMGISFTVYSEGENIDRSWPFDIIPRTIMRSEWTGIAEGLEQRLRALNMFITDVYNDARIIKDKIVPSDLLKSSKNYRKECEGITPALGVWAHICGTDLIRDSDGTMYVLEDNLRVPSGVSYMLENRNISKRVLPELLRDYHVLPMDDYPMQLFDTLSSISPRPKDFPEVVVLTPGIYNSAYFEHAFLAQRMGAELVEGQDLVVGEDDCVYMKNVEGLSRVDVIYRRIDDLFIDPEAFHPDSVLGCRGLMRAWKKGNVALANAPGAGVADDKVVYNYVPDMIRYYLSEEPKLPNVPSFMCTDPKQLQHVLQNLESLVVKPANESGGYGLYIGPKATKRQTSEVKRLIKANPREFIAQPVINLSTVPTFCGNQIEPRHVDLRPFVLQGNKSYVTEGGLSRVALVKGSLVVNSSQGGGSKDTWIIDNRRDIAKGGE
jgi:uncharacterized circularly permuted ATP-grasp superfamily protein